jgi:hypothetical protein
VTKGRGCRWFWAWAVVGSTLTFSLFTALSVGVFVLPLALVLLWLVLRASPRWPESIGLAEGVGFVLLLVAYLNRDHQPCSTNGGLQLPADAPVGASISCGGLDPHPWLYTGLVLAALAAVGYAAVRRHSNTH